MMAREIAGSRTRPGMTRLALSLLCGTVLSGIPAVALAQDAAPVPGAPADVAPQADVIRSTLIAIVSTIALVVGLVIVNLAQPGAGMNVPMR